MTHRQYALSVIKQARIFMLVVIALNALSLIINLIVGRYEAAFFQVFLIALLVTVEVQHQALEDAFAIIEHQEQVLARRAWPWN